MVSEEIHLFFFILDLEGVFSHTINMTKKPKRPKDINQLAKFIVDLTTKEKPKKKKAQTKKPAPRKKS